MLSDNSVLLTVTSIGSARMTNVRMFYTEAEQPSWKRLDFSSEWKFTVVGGLDPRTSYFFKVKAKLGGKMKQSVTHITTPPHGKFEAMKFAPEEIVHAKLVAVKLYCFFGCCRYNLVADSSGVGIKSKRVL